MTNNHEATQEAYQRFTASLERLLYELRGAPSIHDEELISDWQSEHTYEKTRKSYGRLKRKPDYASFLEQLFERTWKECDEYCIDGELDIDGSDEDDDLDP